MKSNERLNDNWAQNLWQAVGEQDVMKLRSQLGNIWKLFDERLRNYSMNTSEHEGTLN